MNHVVLRPLGPEDAEEMLAFARAAGGETQNLFSLAVSVRKSHWNRGIATEMVQRLAERARGMGAEVLELQVLCSNAAAIHVYEKLGFSIAGTYRKFFRYGPGEYADAYWMNLYL